MKKENFYLGGMILLGVLLVVGGYAYFSLSERVDVTGYVVDMSQVGNLSAGIKTFIVCTWSNDALNVSFGANLDPGTNGTNATGNNLSIAGGTMYNMTVGELTTTNIDLEIRGSDLVDGVNILGIGNVSYSSNRTLNNAPGMIYSSSFDVTGSYVDMQSNIPKNINSVIHYRFWLDVPEHIVAGSYVGNYTQMCTEA